MPNAAASVLTLEPFSEKGVIRAARQALAQLGCNPSVAFVFASADYGAHLEDFLELIQLHAHAPLILGGSASGLVGIGEESESQPGFSLLLLSLPETRLTPLAFNEPQSDDFSPEDWRKFAGTGADSDAWIVLLNPAKAAAEPWLKRWSSAFPKVPSLGALLSANDRSDEMFAFLNQKPVEAGVALGLKGGFTLHTIVSQGCRPIGEPHAITGLDSNLVRSIGSRDAFEILKESIESLTPQEKARAAGNIFAGLALNEYVDDFKTGDFLIRSILGADPESGAVALAAAPRLGQTLQFQLRDRHSAHEELLRMLSARTLKNARPVASLVFACGGRGIGLFDTPHHDAVAIQERFGPIPTAGLFCNGEIGPVGGRAFLHGYTAVIGLLE
jgi:small ligand-binding sensory domain FIST